MRAKTKPQNLMVCIKFPSVKEKLELKARAKVYNGGNLSGWLRRAGKEYTPLEALEKYQTKHKVVVRKRPDVVAVVIKADDPGDFF